MTQTLSSSQVLCRPAVESDYPDIAEFCKGIWDGGDYVPNVWHHWLKDPHGLLATAEYDGHAIGCAKLSLLAEGQWWLEGFRVDPQKQGLKVGSRLHEFMTGWWQANCDGILRLMTSSQNLPVHHLCNRTGYSKIREVCGYKSAPLAEPADGLFSPVTDIREAAVFARASESLRLTDGLADFGWRIGEVNEQSLARHSSGQADFTHAFAWWRDRQALVSTWEDEEDGKRTLVPAVLACALHGMPSLLTDLRRLAAQLQFDELFLIAFDLPQVTSQIEAGGFWKHWEHNAFIFEKSVRA
jgi:GNAT superfamily N-acetyltransferase